MFFPWQDADDAQARGKAQERDAGTETASNKLTLLYMMGTAGVNPEKRSRSSRLWIAASDDSSSDW